MAGFGQGEGQLRVIYSLQPDHRGFLGPLEEHEAAAIFKAGDAAGEGDDAVFFNGDGAKVGSG